METLPKGPFSLILSDPPWLYDDRRTHASAGMALSAYPCMPVADICALPVGAVAAKDSILALWTTFPKLREGLRVVEAWGFRFVTVGFVWVKLNPAARRTWHHLDGLVRVQDGYYNGEKERPDIYSGLGHYTNANAEVVLFGRRGKGLPRVSRSVKQIVIAPRGRHSAKPPEVRDRLVALFGDVPRLEMFARPPFGDGWTYWGNEADQSVDVAVE